MYEENDPATESFTGVVQEYLSNQLANYYHSSYINVNYDNQSINYKISTFISQIDVTNLIKATKNNSEEVVLEINSLP
ncbi:hypothetical protein J6P52_01355, partial [bacterium]|nr:hypothetical protein [bacterium]